VSRVATDNNIANIAILPTLQQYWRQRQSQRRTFSHLYWAAPDPAIKKQSTLIIIPAI
jgi:hypothetical protein